MADLSLFQPNARIGIWGMGLLGGAVGLALKKRGHRGRIVGIGRNPARLAVARHLGACDETSDAPDSVVPDLDFLVLCVPVDSVLPLLASVKAWLHEGLTLTDVGSTKGRLVHEIDELVSQSPARYVGSHPMAGSEKTGVEASTPDLYVNATVAVTPTAATRPGALEFVTAFWERLGAKVITLEPALHDRLVAATSHVPHLVGALLCQLLARRQREGRPYRSMIGNGFLDTTRVAAGDPVMWRDILVHNRDEIAAGLFELRDLLDELLAALRHADGPALEKMLADAAEVRKGLERCPSS
ncbi:prephenate dehydrogenase/arogenate dehydrogenase family protein [bacterium]|nr:prephenate dehydrogenase/arogenate dehydrogenase family protein [bacterium]